MVQKFLYVAGASLLFTGCSGSGGGGGGGGGGGSPAGFVGAPSAKCAGTSCVPGASLSLSGIHTSAVSVDRAVDVYEAFNNSFITKLNQFLAKVYAGMVAGGSTSCSDVDIGGSGVVNGYSFSITAADKFISTDFTKVGVAYQYRIHASVSGTPVADIQVYCGQDTVSDPLTVTAIVDENGDKYEFTYEKSGNKIRVIGAGILSDGGRMIASFNTIDGDDFGLIVKSNVDGTTDFYKARGKKSIDSYNIENVTQSSTACVTGTGGVGNCAAISIVTPALTVSSSNNWGTVDVGTFTIAAPQ